MTGDRTKSHDDCLQHPVQRGVYGQLVETARQKVGADDMARNLATNVQLAAEQGQFVLTEAISVRQPASYRRQQTVCEHPDEKFEQFHILSSKVRELAVRDRKTVSYGQHVHERIANGAVRSVDLRKDFDVQFRYGENADDLRGLQARAGRSGKYGLGNP